MNERVNRTTITNALRAAGCPEQFLIGLMRACRSAGIVPTKIEFQDGPLIAVSGEARFIPNRTVLLFNNESQTWCSKAFDDEEYSDTSRLLTYLHEGFMHLMTSP